MQESIISRTALAIRILKVYSLPARKPEFEQRIAPRGPGSGRQAAHRI